MNETIKALTEQRISLDALKVGMAQFPNSRGKALSFTALEKGRMWIGEVCRELGKEYPYEATKTATTAEGIQEAVDTVTKGTVVFLIKENEITNLNEMRHILEQELTLFVKYLSNIEVPSNWENKFAMDCAASEAYRSLKEARMWLGIRLGEIRDNA